MSEIYCERHPYAGKRPVPPGECKGAPESQVIYEYMWGPQEFFATGTSLNLKDFLESVERKPQ